MEIHSEPVFLIGAERSGTTLLRLMLDAHPQLAWAGEFDFAVDLVPEAEGWPPLDAYYDFLATHRIFQAMGCRIDRSLPYPDLMRSFLAQQAQRAGKPRVGATVHRHFDRLLRIWPQARFIHLVRDPRDVARSCIGMGWAGNVWTGIERWITAEELWARLRSSLAADRRCEVTFEALIAQPEEVLGRICDFIGLTFDAAMLTYPERTTYSRPDPSLVQQWRNTLSRVEVQLVESRTGTLLKERGYEPSGLPALEVTAAMKLRLRLQDRWARLRYSLKRYGWWLRLAESIARRLKIRPLERRLRLRMNAIAESNLK